MVTVVVMVKVMVKKCLASLSIFKFKSDGESVAQVRDRAARAAIKHKILQS